MEISLQRPCPVCTNTEGEVLHHQQYHAPSELNAPAEVDIVACARCGLGFADLPTTQATLDETYRDHSKYADTSLYAQEDDENEIEFQMPTDAPWDLQRLAGTAAWLATKVDPSVRVLDAGCATGALLGFLQKEGFRNIVGLDPSPVATATAARAYGVQTVTGSFLTPPDDIGQFDVVVLSHVLEHIADVAGSIAGMWQLTRPGGFVYIEVPDAERYVDHLVAPYHDFNTEHINHFSGRVLRLAMELGGFETVLVEQKDVLCSPTDLYPATYGLFRRTKAPATDVVVERDDALVDALRRYATASGELLNSIGERIRHELGGDPLVVWGAGQLSMKLLAGPLSDMDVVALVDTSAGKWGQRYGDLVVVGPADLPADDTPLLVTSIHHQASIRASIESSFPGRSVTVLRD